jgi:murein DD-endopeptidase MepM/ murein hydrolase activator NlpD
MAERSIAWQVLADFTRARRGARATREEIEELDRSQDRLNRNSARSDRQAEQAAGRRRRSESQTAEVIQDGIDLMEESGRTAARTARQSEQAAGRHAASNRGVIESLRQTAQARRDDARAAAASASADEQAAGRHRASSDGVVASIRAMAAARRENSAAASRESAAVDAARARSEAADAARIRSLNAVTSAQRDYNRVLRTSGADSDEAAAAERRLVRTRSEHAEVSRRARSASTDFNRALSASAGVVGAADAGGKRLNRTLQALGPGFLKAFPAVTAGALLGIVAIMPQLIGLLSQLSAGLTAVASNMISMVGAAGAIPQVMIAAAGGIATLIAAFGGIGDALKGYQKSQDAANKTGAASALAARQRAKAIADAERALARAREAQADTARENSRRLEDAEDNVVDAQRSAIAAQDALTRARQTAQRTLQDLKNDLDGLAQSEEGASIALARAQQRLAEVQVDPNATDLDRREAVLAVKEAQTSLEQARTDNKRAQKDAEETRKKGVKGADEVVAAQKSQQDATENIAEAYQNLSDVQRENKRATRDAAQAVADAAFALGSARMATDAATTANDDYAESMAKLSPEGRAFVKTLISLKPKLDAIRNAAQKGLLPGLGRSLVEVSKLTPLVERGMLAYGRSIGNSAENLAKYLTSTKASDEAAKNLNETQRKQFGTQSMLERIMGSNVKLTDSAGRTTGYLARAFINLADSGRDFTEWLFSAVEGWAKYLAETAEVNNRNGDTAAGFDKIKERMQAWGNIISNVFFALLNVGKAASDSGDSMVGSIEDVTKKWRDWTEKDLKGENRMKEWFDKGEIALRRVTRGVGKLAKGFFNLGKNQDTGPLMDSVERVGKAIGRITTALDKNGVGTAFLEIVANLAEVFASLVESAAPVTGVIYDIIGAILAALGWFLRLKGVAPLLTAIFAGFMAFKAIGFIVGLLGLIQKGFWALTAAMSANPFMLLVIGIVAAAYLIYKYWDQISAFIMKGVDWVLDFIRKHWKIVAILGGPVGLAVALIVKHWDKIKKLFSAAISFVKALVTGDWKKVGDMLSSGVDSAKAGIKKAWDKIQELFSNGVAGVKKIMEGIGSVFDNPGAAFKKALNWIITGTNKVLSFLGIKNIPEIKGDPPKSSNARGGDDRRTQLNMARGGVVPGQGNRDSVPANLMPGEFVVRKAAVKRIGAGNLAAMSEGKRRRGRKPYAQGGEVGEGSGTPNNVSSFAPAPPTASQGGIGDAIKNAVKGAKDVAEGAYEKIKDAGGKVVDLGRLGASKGIGAVFKPIRAFVNNAFPGNGGLGQTMRAFPNKMMDGITQFVKGVDKEVGGGGGSDPSKGFPVPVKGIHPAGVWGHYASGGSHPALDFPMSSGHAVHAIARGKVNSVKHLATSYGNHVRISHGKGYESIYGHLSQTLTDAGARVGTKNVIGKSGNSGNSTGPHLHLEIRKSGAPVNFTKWMRFARGGKVPGKRNKRDWEQDALLTPGEFVFNRDAAQDIGIRELERLNRGKGDDTNQYHKGGEVSWTGTQWGPVLGMRQGAQGAIPWALQFLANRPINGVWDAGLNSALAVPNAANLLNGPAKPSGESVRNFMAYLATSDRKAGGTATHTVSNGETFQAILQRYYGSATNDQLKKVIKANGMNDQNKLSTKPKVGKVLKLPGINAYKGGHSAEGAIKWAGGNESKLFAHIQAMYARDDYNKKTTQDQRESVKDWYDAVKGAKSANIAALNSTLGLGEQGEGWNVNSKSAMAHVLDHAFGRAHPDLAYRPWEPWSGAEAALIGSDEANAKMQQYNGFLEILSNWGLSDLVEDLIGKGVDDGYVIAQSASVNKGIATQLNESIKAGTAINVDDQSSIFRLISLYSSQTGAGLRQSARTLGKSDLETVTLFDRANKDGRFNAVPRPNMSAMLSDIEKFRKGTFYAATGGQVPGVGNRDTVPAMLTPGEFVLKKSAAKALGMQNLLALNGIQGLNGGGLVEALSGFGATPYSAGGTVQVPSLSGYQNLGEGGKKVYVDWHVEINNPVAETSTKSLTKMLQRRAVISGATPIGEAGEPNA